MLRSRRLHRGLVLSEVALSIVPLIAAGLMLRTFANLLETPIGFDPAHVVTARVSLNLGAVLHGRSPVGVLSRRDRARAGAARCRGGQRRRPTSRWRRFRAPSASGEARIERPTSSIGMHRSIMPGYFGVMGIPLRAGRDISDDDIIHRRRVAVVDERLAAQLWQGDAIGKRLSVE